MTFEQYLKQLEKLVNLLIDKSIKLADKFIKTMKRFHPSVRTLCRIAMALSVIAVVMAFVRCTPFNVENGTDIVVSVLVAVVTIYMFIHVIDDFYIDRRIRKIIIEEQKKIRKYVDEEMGNNRQIMKYYVYFFQALNEGRHSQIECALNYLFRSLDYLNQSVIRDKEYLKLEIYAEIERLISNFPAVTISNNENMDYRRILFCDTANSTKPGEIAFLLQSRVRKVDNLEAFKETPH